MSVRTIVKSIQDIMRQDTGIDGDAQRISQLCWMFFLKIIDDQDQELELLKDGYRSPVPERFQWRAWAAEPEGSTGNDLLAFINTELFPALKELHVSDKPGDRSRVVRDVFEDAYNYMKSGQLMRQVVNKINSIDFNNLTERQHFGVIYEQILNDLQSAGNAGEYYTPRAVTAFMVDRIDPKPGERLFDPACGTGGFLTCAIRHMRERYVKKTTDEWQLQNGLRAVEKKQLPHMLCVTNMLLHGIEDPSFVRHDNTLARPYISWGQSDRVDIVLTNPPFGGREEGGIESNFPQHFRTRETADLFLALIIRLLKPGGRAAVVLPDGSLFGEGVKTRLKEHLMEECNLHTIVRLPNSVFRPYASIGTNLLFFEKGEPTKDIWYWEHHVPGGQKAYSMTKPIRLEDLADCIAWWGGPSREGRQDGPQAWKVNIRAIIDEARARAKPHWDEGERLARKEASVRARILHATADARALEDGPATSDAERRAKAIRADIATLRKEAAEAGEAARRERSTGDSIYSAAFNLDVKKRHAEQEDQGDPKHLLADLTAAEAEATAMRDQLKAILSEALAFRPRARFALDTLSVLTTRPDQIKPVRQTILNLAVRGKLVAQDQLDEPASELLKRIAAAKAQLVKAGEIRREKVLPPLSDADRAFELPNRWTWVRLGDLSQLVTSGSRDWAKYYSNEGAIFVRMGNLSKDHYRLRLDHIQRVSPPRDGEGTRTRLEPGDILISITGDVGMLGLIPDDFGEAYINQHTAMIRPMPEMKGRYLAELFRSPFAQEQFNGPQRGVKNSFRLTDVTQFVVPLPPLAEQHRIVARIDELMTLCDRLEFSLITADSTRLRLLQALLHEALEPAAGMLEAAE